MGKYISWRENKHEKLIKKSNFAGELVRESATVASHYTHGLRLNENRCSNDRHSTIRMSRCYDMFTTLPLLILRVRVFTACGNNRRYDSKRRMHFAACYSLRLYMFHSAAQCVRRIIARGLLVFLLFPARDSRREAEKFFPCSEQSWKNFPTGKSFRPPVREAKSFSKEEFVRDLNSFKWYFNLLTIFDKLLTWNEQNY